MEQEDKKLEIKYGGELHEIDLELLIESLTNYSIVTQETAAYISSSITVNIKVKAPKEGSFIILLDLITKNTSDLFTRENISLASEIITCVGGLYGLKKWIANNGKPEVIKQIDDNNIEIKNKNGNITIDQKVYNIYQGSPRVRENLRKTFSKLKEAEEIEDFTIKDITENKQIFTATKGEFEKLASDDDEIEQKKQKLIKENQELSVFKVVFQENYKWEFFYLGNKIYASLSDQEFFKKIEKGEVAFRSGDRLVADLEIEQVFNEAANTFINNIYKIVKVKEHIPRTIQVQSQLNFED